MDKLRDIKIEGGDFELIRLAEDSAFGYGSKRDELYYYKKELEKLKDAKEMIVEWECAPSEEFERVKNFLGYYGFDYSVKELV